MTKSDKLSRIKQLKAEINEAHKKGDCSDEVVAKINECTRLILEILEVVEEVEQMWNEVKSRITRAIGGTIYSIYGEVAFKLNYIDGVVYFTLFDRPSKHKNKKVISEHSFRYDMRNKDKYTIIHDIVFELEKHILCQ